MPKNKREAFVIALAFTFISHAVLAQAAGGDILGVQQPVSWAVAAMRLIAACGVGFGFIRLMGGHRLDGLAMMGVGALGVGKSDAIASAMGL